MRSLTRTVLEHGLMLLIVLAVAASAGAQGASTRPAPSPATVIVPGQAIGPWTLDMSHTDLLWSLGTRRPFLSGLGPQFRNDLVVSVWASPNVVAFHDAGDDIVHALGIAEPEYATRERIGVGATEDQVIGAYGLASSVLQLPARPKFLIYDARGLAFQMRFNTVSGTYGPVERVFVFRPGRARVIWRTP